MDIKNFSILYDIYTKLFEQSPFAICQMSVEVADPVNGGYNDVTNVRPVMTGNIQGKELESVEDHIQKYIAAGWLPDVEDSGTYTIAFVLDLHTLTIQESIVIHSVPYLKF